MQDTLPTQSPPAEHDTLRKVIGVGNILFGLLFSYLNSNDGNGGASIFFFGVSFVGVLILLRQPWGYRVGLGLGWLAVVFGVLGMLSAIIRNPNELGLTEAVLTAILLALPGWGQVKGLKRIRSSFVGLENSAADMSRTVASGIRIVSQQLRQKLHEETTFDPSLRELFWSTHIGMTQASFETLTTILDGLDGVNDPEADGLRDIARELAAIARGTANVDPEAARYDPDALRAAAYSAVIHYKNQVQSISAQEEWQIYSGVVGQLGVGTATPSPS